MKNETLYTNDEKFGESAVGMWEQFRNKMDGNFRVWYNEYCDQFADQLAHGEIDADEANPLPYNDWVESIMDECLYEASADDIAKYAKL